MKFLSKAVLGLRSHLVSDRPKTVLQGIVEKALFRTRQFINCFTWKSNSTNSRYRYQFRLPQYRNFGADYGLKCDLLSRSFCFRPTVIRTITSRWASNSLVVLASKEVRKRIFYGCNGPTLAFVGFVLAKKPSLLSEEEELAEELSFEIRETFSKLSTNNIDQKSSKFTFHDMPKFNDLKIGSLLAQGCNAAVYSAHWNHDLIGNEVKNGVEKDEKVVISDSELSLRTDQVKIQSITETTEKVIVPHAEFKLLPNIAHKNVYGKHLSVGKLIPFDLAVKLMFNYDAESNAYAIWKAMYKEMLPAVLDFPHNKAIKACKKKRHRLPPHPNIVEMYCAFIDQVPLLPGATTSYPQALPVRLVGEGLGRNMTLFLVMKRYHCNLKEYLKVYQPSCETALLLLCQLLEGLVHLQQYQIAHRDLKTDNILLDLSYGLSKPFLAITDFGCCLETFKLSYVSEEISKGGNMALMAPEVVTAAAGPFSVIDYSRSDLWTVATIAYEIFGASNPFYETTDNYFESSTYEEKDLPPFPSRAPVTIQKLVCDMLSKDPCQRPSPSLAATVCQLLLYKPPEFFENFSALPKDEIIKWMFNMSLETFLQAVVENGQSTSVEFQLQYTLCSRIQFCELLEALRYISNSLRCM